MKMPGNNAPTEAGARGVPRRALREGAGINTGANFSTDAFRAAILAAGFSDVPTIVPGRLIRFPGIGKRRSNRAGWGILFEDGRAGVFGDWASGMMETWRAEKSRPVTPAERARLRAEIEAARRQREAEQRERHQRAAAEARRLWGAATPEMGTHRYLIEKGIEPHGIRSNGHELVILVADVNGDPKSLQLIAPDGRKRFLPGGKISGGMYLIGDVDPAGKLLVAEGFATAATLRERTGRPVAVAFNCTNLKPVAKAVRSKYPEATLIIAADNDRHTPGNPGVTKAAEAALAVGGRVAVPEFPEGAEGTDFNDLARIEEVSL